MLPRLRPLLKDDTVVVPAINGLPWWYFYREAGPYEGRSVRTLDADGTMFAELDSATSSAASCTPPARCARPARCTIPAAAG